MIIPAILAKTKRGLISKLSRVPKKAKSIQIDIMDGVFVSNKTIQPKDIPKTKQKKEFHLMVKDPLAYIKQIKTAEYIIFHYESDKKNIKKIIETIKNKNIKVGMAIKPKTKIEEIKPFLKDLDLLLIMTIYPGAMGKELLPNTIKKITSVQKAAPQLIVEVDGGINEETILKAKEAGASRFVVGSAIMRKKDTNKAFEKINNLLK